MSKGKLVSVLMGTFLAACLQMTGLAPEASAGQAGSFSGSWVASGKLQPFEFTKGRDVATFTLAGHVNLADVFGGSEDYWAKCVGLSDSVAGSAARCVWRSLEGDQVYSILKGEPLEKGQKVSGEFVGGTGRLKGIAGKFTFTWISTFTDERQNTFTGHTRDLKGAYQVP